MTSKVKPTLVIIAGPNGAGKTTITEQLLSHHWLENAVYVNPDNIAQEKFGGWNNKESFIKAANYAEKIREKCLKNKQNLVFETVFSTQGKIDFIKKAIKQGYFIRFFFIATKDPAINAKRIVNRVASGGHEVPIGKIISRHQKSILNCKKIINLVDRSYIYDNSIDEKRPELIFRTAKKDKTLIKQYTDLHDWSASIAYDFVMANK
jgi:predicted ABC-type ATPase